MAKGSSASHDGAAAIGGEPVFALEPRYYTDPAQFELEKEKVFYRTWQYAGHLSQLRRAGDFFTFEICDQRLFTIKGRDGDIRTFYNVCMHRAHELLAGAGNTQMITCPYHAWSYGLDGRFRRAPNQEKATGFDGSGICLTQVHTEVFAGFVFVNLDPEARPMASWYPEAEEQLRAYVPDIEALCPVAWLPVEEDCNWKVSVENYSECYHCGINHPTFAKGVVDPKRYDIRPQGYCLRHQTRAVNLEAMTYPVDPTANAHALDYSSWFLWPGFSFQVYPGNLLNTYHWQPTGAETVTVNRGWYTADGVDSEVVSRLARQDLDTTVAEDLRLVNSVQRGLHSRGYRPGPLLIDPDFGVNSEHSLSALKDWLGEALAG